MKSNLQTIIYATVLGIVCSALLTGVKIYTNPYQEANKEAEKIRHIMTVLDVPIKEGTSTEDLLKMFKESVKEIKIGDLTGYEYSAVQDGVAVKRTAIPFSGPGLWGPIKGFIALKADTTTISGLTFHEQEETPGLGGDIATKGFTDRFIGKKISQPDKTYGIKILRAGGASASNEVDGITGATMTGDLVQKMLNKTIKKIVESRDNNVK